MIAGATMLFLFVEDDENVAVAFAELAASLGHPADVARTGGDALRMTGQTRYDCVFMDIELPDIDGRRVCEYVRCAGASTDACIVAVTGSCKFDINSLGQFDGYLPKPVTASELTGIIESC
jgi:CheY-like chemotaxis protein